VFHARCSRCLPLIGIERLAEPIVITAEAAKSDMGQSREHPKILLTQIQV